MRLIFLVRRTLLIVAAAVLPCAAQQVVPLNDQLLNMTANYITCPQGFHCEGAMIHNPVSLDPMLTVSVIRQDGRMGFIMPARLWTFYPGSQMDAQAGIIVMPFAPATDILKNVLLPKRVLPMFPGARIESIQHKDQCVAMQDRTDCAGALLSFTSREGQPMEAFVDTMCRYEQPGANLQFNDVTFLISFAPKGQLQSVPSTPQMRVDPTWHAREQQRARQFSIEYQNRLRQQNNQIIATGQEQLAAIHHYGEVVRQEDRRSQRAIDDVAQDAADTVGDRFTDHVWRNSRGEYTHTDSNQSPGPGWVQIRQ